MTTDRLPEDLQKWHFTRGLVLENPKSFRTNSSKNNVEGLLLVFQRFKQYNSEICSSVLKFQKLFLHRIFKSAYTFLHFCGILQLDSEKIVGCLWLGLLNLFRNIVGPVWDLVLRLKQRYCKLTKPTEISQK